MKNRKNGSFTQTINGRVQWHRLKTLLLSDLGLSAAIIAAWSLAVESQYGTLCVLQPRAVQIHIEGGLLTTLRSISYSFSPKASEAVFTVGLGEVLSFLAVAIPCLLALQLIGWGVNWSRNARFIRRTLRPLNDMVREAQRIAASGINEQQLHNMERAIDNVTDSEACVSIGDADLAGVEAAINNLLRRLRKSYAEQTRFVDDASHELRTPIAVIHGYSAMLDRWGKNDPETLDESVRAILEESEHMQTLVDQLLFLARGDGGRQQLTLCPMDASALLQEICEENRMIDENHEYVFRGGEALTVMGDPAMLKQAIRVLTDNAAKYTPAGRRVTLSTERRDDGRIGLCVSDQGVGLSQEEASRMFERFYRGSAVRGSTKGSGLGLSIAAWIVEHHHGSIEVLGYQDIGTRVTVLLPAASAE